MSKPLTEKWCFPSRALSVAGLILCAAAAQAAPVIEKVQGFDENEDFFNEEFFAGERPSFPGVAFPPGASTLLVADQPVPGRSTLLLVAPPKNGQGRVSRTALEISDPINLAFDAANRGAEGHGIFRLFLLEKGSNELLALKTGARGAIDPASLHRVTAQQLGVANPQGMTVDPASGELFILDGGAGSPQLLRIKAQLGRRFDGAAATRITLPTNLQNLRGIAFNPADGHLYLLSSTQQKLYEVTVAGELLASLDMGGYQPGELQGMVFAPSVDLTDPPLVFHLYVAARGGPHRGLTEWSLKR